MGGLKLKFKFEKVEERPIEYAKLKAKGQGVGAIVGMDTEFYLTPIDGDRTSMRWVADVHVAGPIGSMGQRVFQPIVNQQVVERPRRARGPGRGREGDGVRRLRSSPSPSSPPPSRR